MNNPYVQYMYSYPHKTAYRPLKGVFLQDYAHLLSGGGHGLYVHIPFCQAKCGFCNLFSVTGQGASEQSHYLDAVERQSRQYKEILSAFDSEFSEVSIGGGTPLLLSDIQLERMFGILEKYFMFSEGRELTIETAPNQTARDKLRILKQAGVTRVSMGIQSFSDQELQALGRRHCAGKAREALELLQSFDFSCVNVDFIYGIPGQTIESLLASLKEALVFEPDEIFLYPLYIKHGAWLKWDFAEKGRSAPDPVFVYSQYQEASAFLRDAGWRQDSMRRFVRRQDCTKKMSLLKLQKKYERRKFAECGVGSSLALGCGGRSYLGNLHFCTPYAVTAHECLKQLRKFEKTEDFSHITHGILLSEEERKRRYVIRHLFIQPGLDIRRYQEYFSTEASEDFSLLQDWKDRGYVEIVCEGNIDYLALTETGLGLSDYLGPQLISSQALERMNEWEAAHERKDHLVSGKLEKL